MKILPFFNIGCIHFFQSYQRFQTTERGARFEERPIPKTLDIFYCGSTTNGVWICKRRLRVIH